ncbi:MAG TPA: ABC transporter ATP-binding protein [Candidatus Omnitrophica bacterium]|nr:ABC transporter ATP-binding protein [Candidatus Omnitrophota bacterium]
MANPIIETKSLSKKYRITHKEAYFTLRDSIVNCFKSPFGIFKKKRTDSSKEDFWALKDVSFDVNPGEVVGVIGRNGAGKTTLLKILSRITYPTEGEIRLRGRVGSLLEVGTGFHPELTGRENIYFNGSILGMKKKEIDKKFDEIVDFSGVEKFIDTPVKRFSSGMQVRLAFSVAAYLEPEILLVDEVLAVGDAEFQKKCLGKMKDISKGGRTILFVSHNMSAIRNLCSRVIMLEGGKISLDSDSETAVSKYLDQNLTLGTSISGKELEAKIEGYINRANPSIRFKEIKLLNQNNEPCSIFNSNEAIKICITYECLNTVDSLRVNICIVDEENREILTTTTVDDEKEVNSYRKNAGVYTSICYISPNMFGEKRLFVSVHLEYPKVEHLVLDRVLGFDVIFLGYNNISAAFKNSFIRPRLKWETQLLDLTNR